MEQFIYWFLPRLVTVFIFWIVVLLSATIGSILFGLSPVKWFIALLIVICLAYLCPSETELLWIIKEKQ